MRMRVASGDQVVHCYGQLVSDALVVAVVAVDQVTTAFVVVVAAVGLATAAFVVVVAAVGLATPAFVVVVAAVGLATAAFVVVVAAVGLATPAFVVVVAAVGLATAAFVVVVAAAGLATPHLLWLLLLLAWRPPHLLWLLLLLTSSRIAGPLLVAWSMLLLLIILRPWQTECLKLIRHTETPSRKCYSRESNVIALKLWCPRTWPSKSRTVNLKQSCLNPRTGLNIRPLSVFPV
jgi:hypothetical protein